MRSALVPCWRALTTVVVVAAVSGACRDRAPVVARATPVAAEAQSTCALDAVRESFCIRNREAACSESGAGAELIVTQDLLPDTVLAPGRPERATFVRDRRTSSGNETCCFTRCALLVVRAVRTPEPNEPPMHPPRDGSYTSYRTCIRKPESGTSVPAAANEACPAAVVSFSPDVGLPRMSVGEATYADEIDGKCCYLVGYSSQW